MSEVKKDWIVTISNSCCEGIFIHRFYGTDDEVKKLLIRLVEEDRIKDEYNYKHGTELKEDISVLFNDYYAYGNYDYYHIDYTAKVFNEITFIKCEPMFIAEEIQWDVEDPDELEYLPDKVVVPKIFLKNEDVCLEDFSEYLTKEYGFCHKGFKVNKKEAIG